MGFIDTLKELFSGKKSQQSGQTMDQGAGAPDPPTSGTQGQQYPSVDETGQGGVDQLPDES